MEARIADAHKRGRRRVRGREQDLQQHVILAECLLEQLQVLHDLPLREPELDEPLVDVVVCGLDLVSARLILWCLHDGLQFFQQALSALFRGFGGSEG